MSKVKIMHFSDVLCVWAYAGQANILKLVEKFGAKISVEARYCSVFPDTQTKINKSWRDRGGFAGYADHVRSVANVFDNLRIHDDVWSRVRPMSSASPHLLIKAIELLDHDESKSAFADQRSNQAATALRLAFFADAQDISDWAVQRAVCKRIGVDFDEVRKKIETGEAIARLAADYELCQTLHVQGSPTYIMNEGRQILFGNISYGILEANLGELLSARPDENASVC